MTLELTMHETAVRALAQQEAALEALRARTGTVLTAASVSASFLGGQAISRNGLTVWVVLALAAFAAVVTLSVYVLLPKRSIFWLDTESIYPDLAPYADDRRLIDRNLARLYRELRALNEPTVTRLGRALTASAGALLLEIVLLAFGVA